MAECFLNCACVSRQVHAVHFQSTYLLTQQWARLLAVAEQEEVVVAAHNDVDFGHLSRHLEVGF